MSGGRNARGCGPSGGSSPGSSTSSIVRRKQAQSRGFFRKLNIAFDLQKQKMFEYYRGRIAARRLEAENLTPETPEKDEKK